MTKKIEQGNRKKLMLITPMLNQGGLEKVCALTAQLMKNYFDVSIVVFDSRDIIYDISGIELIDLKTSSKKGKIGKIINVFIRSNKLRKIKKTNLIDIAYSFGPSANIPNILSKNNNCKTWVGFRSYLDLANRSKLQLICARADKVICCAKEIENELRTMVKGINVVTVYNPFDVYQIQKCASMDVNLPWDDNQKIIVSMGRENDVKGFWHLIKSFSLISECVENTRLMIIGEGEYLEYRKLAEELGVKDKIYFTGVKSNPYSYLSKAYVYVLTSLNEGFPNALVEAMALSIPVIATNCKSGPAEILLNEYKEVLCDTYVDADYGLLLPELSREKNLNAKVIEKEEIIMAKAILSLLENTQKYEYYKKQAQLRAKDFSNELYMEKIMKIVREYNEIL